MKATIREKGAMYALRPMDTALYLHAKGWRRQSQNERVSFWFDGGLGVCLV